MGLDPQLAAAVTLRRQRGLDGVCEAHDEVFQLSLANVLLDGGFDGIVSLAEVMPAGDHGLGTVDRLDGELVVVDGEPWRIPATGRAERVPLETLTPFVVLTTMQDPIRVRVRDISRDEALAEIERLVDDPSAVVAVRLEGLFSRVLVRSVPAQEKPYRPYAEICASDEIRWEHHDFNGVFVGFRFPDLAGSGDTIGGLHLHGLDDARTTGGHNHEMHIADAELSVSVTHDVALALPDRSMIELLEMPTPIREVQRLLLRRGPSTASRIAALLEVPEKEVLDRLTWLADRGFVEQWETGLAGLGGEPRWRITLRKRAHARSAHIEQLLGGL